LEVALDDFMSFAELAESKQQIVEDSTIATLNLSYNLAQSNYTSSSNASSEAQPNTTAWRIDKLPAHWSLGLARDELVFGVLLALVVFLLLLCCVVAVQAEVGAYRQLLAPFITQVSPNSGESFGCHNLVFYTQTYVLNRDEDLIRGHMCQCIVQLQVVHHYPQQVLPPSNAAPTNQPLEWSSKPQQNVEEKQEEANENDSPSPSPPKLMRKMPKPKAKQQESVVMSPLKAKSNDGNHKQKAKQVEKENPSDNSPVRNKDR